MPGALLLAAELASYLTGSQVIADGGWLLRQAAAESTSAAATVAAVRSRAVWLPVQVGVRNPHHGRPLGAGVAR